MKKVENGETILYINRYYEKNLTTGNVTSYYYLGDRLVATSENATLRYVHQDHLSGTSLVTSDNGTSLGTITYYPYGATRSGSVPTDKKFTRQRLDDTGLYFYNARYYDPTIGRFISPDPLTQSAPLPQGQIIKGLTVYITGSQFSTFPIPTPAIINPQEHNRYSYAVNNPLRYIDPDGHQVATALEITRNAAFGVASVGALIPVWGWAVAGGAMVVGGAIILEQETGFLSNTWNYVTDRVSGTLNVGILFAKHKDSEKASDIISNEKAGNINRKFPSEWRDKTYGEIKEAAKNGDKSARTAKKLLDQTRFNK